MFSENWDIFWLALTIALFALAGLTITETLLHRKLRNEKDKKNKFFEKRMKKLVKLKNDPRAELDSLLEILQDFISKKYRIKLETNTTHYLEKISRRNKKCAKLYQDISNAIFSGELINQNNVESFKKRFSEIISKDHSDKEQHQQNFIKKEIDKLENGFVSVEHSLFNSIKEFEKEILPTKKASFGENITSNFIKSFDDLSRIKVKRKHENLF